MKQKTNSNPSVKYIRLICLLSVYLLHVEARHQRWYLLGCHCRNWSSWQYRKTFRDTVLDMYRGLFMKPGDLNRIPVVKPKGSTPRHGETTYIDGIRPRARPGENARKSCCHTDYSYEVFNQTVYANTNQNVVHFDNAFQFVPTGRCGANITCGIGQCLQMYRHHWMLVWDDTLPHFPPVTFVPVEVPSHCECVNVGTE